METAEQTSQAETTLDQQQIIEDAGNKSPGKRTIDQVEGEISKLPESKKQNSPGDDTEVVNEVESKEDEYKITTPVTGFSEAIEGNNEEELKPVDEEEVSKTEQSEAECVEPGKEGDQSSITDDTCEGDTTVQVDYSNEESPELQSSNDGTVVDLSESIESAASTDSEKPITVVDRSTLTQSSTCNPTILEDTTDLKNDNRTGEAVC